MSELIASPATPSNCPGPIRRLVPPPPAQFHPTIQSSILRKRTPYTPTDLTKLLKRFQTLPSPDFPLDSRFERICIDMCTPRDCYSNPGAKGRYSPMFVLRKVGDSYSYGLDGEPRRHAEPYSYVLTRTFTRIRTAAARRHEPGNEKFLAAHNNMQTFVGFFEYAQSLDTTVKPNQCYKLIETFRYLLDEVLETSK